MRAFKLMLTRQQNMEDMILCCIQISEAFFSFWDGKVGASSRYLEQKGFCSRCIVCFEGRLLCSPVDHQAWKKGG
jgi:hypothetical protein